jgi:hypothetical protein
MDVPINKAGTSAVFLAKWHRLNDQGKALNKSELISLIAMRNPLSLPYRRGADSRNCHRRC